MSTEEFLRKLDPLVPGRVRSWRRSLAIVDEKTRHLLEHHIASEAHRRLRDPGGFLLSLPPRERATGRFDLGMIRYDEPRWPVGLRADELVQHVGIYGRSGAGKTNVLFHLLSQFAQQRVPFVFLDWKRTGRHLLPLLHERIKVYTPGRDLAPFSFNPLLAPPGFDPALYAHHVVDLLARSYTLGDGATSLIHKALLALAHDKIVATPALVLAHVQSVPDQERVRGWKISAIRALESLLATGLVSTPADQERTISALLHQSTILELDGLSASTKEFLVPLVCLWLYHARLSASVREQLSLVLVIEEAHHVLYAHQHHETTMEMLLRQCRELGIAIIVLDQHPHLLSSAALGNTYTSIVLNLKDPTDLTKAARLSLIRPEDAHHLSTLPIGTGVVKLQDRWHQPFLVEFPHVPVQKGSVTDERLREYLDGKTTLSAPAPPVASRIASLGRPRLADEARFLADIVAQPTSGVDERYRRLGLSPDTGTRLKRRLTTLGLIQEERVRTGRTHRTLLRLTTRAHDLTTHDEHHRHESLTHEYYKRVYADDLRARGYEVAIEVASSEMEGAGGCQQLEECRTRQVAGIGGVAGARHKQPVILCTVFLDGLLDDSMPVAINERAREEFIRV
jgi:hypothetical protein